MKHATATTIVPSSHPYTGSATYPRKVEAMLTWPKPRTVNELRGFIGRYNGVFS